MCELVHVSEATVRRDMDELASRNLVQRIYGGVSLPSLITVEPSVFQRRSTNQAQKRMIGELAASLIQDGETIFLGSGSTTLEVARSLKHKKNITVITNSLPIVNLLADSSGVQVVVTGGYLRQAELSMIGHIVEQSLSELRSDKVIMGIQGIHPEHGLTNNYLPETKTDRAIVRVAPVVFVVADHSKFGQLKSSFVADLSAVHTLITDSEAPSDMVENITGKGIRVLIAAAE